MGPFRLSDPNGGRIEIASKKGMALIAMVAMARDGERTRSWLQDKLWGQRRQQEGRGSLRRELSTLRRILNEGGEPILLCSRDRVGLALDRMDVDALSLGGGDLHSASGVQPEFLEGLDIAGEEGFEEWLRDQRGAIRALFSRPAASLGPERGATVPRPSPDALAASAPPRGFDAHPALAVLRFANATGDNNSDYLAEGVSEELTDRLSRLRWIPVIARSSSFSVAPGDDRIAAGRALGAKYVLDGRLRAAEGSYWLWLDLVDTPSGYTAWSHRFAIGDPTSHAAMEALVTEVVAQLEARIDNVEQVSARGKPENLMSVNDLIWKGRWHLSRLTREDSQLAQDLLMEALRIDPHSSEALIQSTLALAWSIWAGRLSSEKIAEMRKLAQRATLADPDDGRGYMLSGIAEMWLRHPLAARALFEKAIELNPSLALAHAQLGSSYNLGGEPTRAMTFLATALRLSPNDLHLFYPLGEMAMALSLLGRWRDVVDYADQALARRPAYWYAHMLKANALARLGDRAAAQAYEDLLDAQPDFGRRHVEWLPFIDRVWIDHFIQGLGIARLMASRTDGDDGLNDTG